MDLAFVRLILKILLGSWVFINASIESCVMKIAFRSKNITTKSLWEHSGVLNKVACAVACMKDLQCKTLMYSLSMKICLGYSSNLDFYKDYLTHVEGMDTIVVRTCRGKKGKKNKKEKQMMKVKEETHCGNLTGSDLSQCILHCQENITASDLTVLLEMPFTVKTGSKLTMYVARRKDYKNSQFTVPLGPKVVNNPLSMLTIHIDWNKKTFYKGKGFFKQSIKGDFPISNPFYFSVALVLKPNSTEIYADNVLLTRYAPITAVTYLNFLRCSKVHLFIIQKTGEGCDELENGFP